MSGERTDLDLLIAHRSLPRSEEALACVKPMIELMQLRKEYDNLVAVDDLTLTVPQGEILD